MTFYNSQIRKLFLSAVIVSATGLAVTSCSDDDNGIETYPIVVTPTMPDELPASYNVESGTITYTEINTRRTYTFNLPVTADDAIPAGTYDIDGTMEVSFAAEDGSMVKRKMRTVASQQVVSASSKPLSLKWFFYNPENTLVFGELYIAGSPNAAGTSGLNDTYFTIYNNSDEVQYADGLAIAESKFTNADNYEILTPANDREANFTAWTVYVIPGSGHDVAIQPGESIKVADQALDFGEQVAGALDNSKADFEWYDESSSATVKDTNNPDVPDLVKWFSYSPTIWRPAILCNRSYALIRFPEGMTVEKFLEEQSGDYKYIGATGKEMSGTKCYLIKYDWIIDGVNLSPDEGWTQGALSKAVDASHTAISAVKTDPARFGKKFARKTAGVSAAGHKILMDTNDSAADFEIVAVK